MKLALKWGSRLVTFILAVILLLTLYATVSARMNGGIPTLFGKQMYEILSGSMEPKVHTGSVIFTNPSIDKKQLQVGDVITFNVPHQPGIIVTHRIVTVKNQNGEPTIETKGDANSSKDTWKLSTKDIIGKYTGMTIPYLGYYLNFLKSKLGISLILIVPGILLIGYSIYTLFREISKLQKKEPNATSVELQTEIQT